MKIEFVDELGVAGAVTEDLSVDYDDRWRDEIEAYVDGLEAESLTDGRRPARDAVDQAVLIGRPGRVPIAEIARRDG